MRDRVKDFEKRDVQVVAVDPHESYRVRHMLRSVGVKADELTFPILADSANTVSATYGVAFQMSIHTEVSNRPATFIIDREGVIRYARRGTTFSDRPSPDVLLKELEKLAPLKN